MARFGLITNLTQASKFKDILKLINKRGQVFLSSLFYGKMLAMKKFWPYFAFAAVTLLFFFRFLDGLEIFAFKDLSRYFYPLRLLMVEQVKSGHIPLWNPYIFCGMPLLATLQICFFYPLSVVYYLIPYDLAFNYYIIIHYFIGASLMYLLMRHYSISKPASFLAGFIFAFSGYLLSVSCMNTTLSSVIWLPLLLLFWDRAIRECPMSNVQFPMKDYLGVVFTLVLMFLGGEPTIIYSSLWVLFFYGLIFSKEKIKTTLILCCFVVIFLLVSAVQV